MATDLAKLVARLELQSGQFQTELQKANKKLSAFDTDVRKVGKRIGTGFKAVLAGITIGAFTAKLIAETSEAEKAVALLTNAVKNNGGAAGQSVAGLTAQAQALQRLTTFSDEAVISAQALLLRFRGIAGPEFQRAQKATLDLATALGVDLDTAAKTVGRALENPLKGMTALRKAGVLLSDSQVATIKNLTATGRSAEAQNVLLLELEKRYGGAAEAAKNTLGGALAGLKNAFGDLFELSSGSSEKTVESINALTDALSNPETKQALDTLISGFTTLASVIVTGVAKAVNALGTLPGALKKGLELEAKNSILLFGTDDQAESATAVRAGGRSRGGKRNPAAVGAGAGEATADVKTLTSTLEEFDVQVKKLQDDPLANYFDQLNDSTKTNAEQTVDRINQLLAAVQALQREGVISADVASTRIQEGLDELLPAFDIQEIQKKRILVQAEVKKLNEYEIEAARATQGVIADSIKSAFSGAFEDIPKRFQEMILDLIIQAQAAKIATYLFGDTGSGGSTGGALSGLLGAFFGGGRDGGGAVYPGQAYMVGERRPEMFVPSTAGRIEPLRSGGGTTVNVSLRAENGQVSRPTQLALGATVARAVSLANRRNN